VLDGRQLVAFTAGGRQLWTYDFQRPVTHPGTFSRGRGTQADLDGDGRFEMLVPIRFAGASRDSPRESDAIVALDQEGRQIWSVQPDLTLWAGNDVFEGPWHIYDMLTGPTAEGPRAWLAFSHHAWWPGFVIEVDARGNQRLRYLQGGRVYSLGYWRPGGRPVLVAGGTAMDPGLSSATIIDLTGPAVRWPSNGVAQLSCGNCPAADPSAVLLFPTSHVTSAMPRPYGSVQRLRPQTGGLQADIDDGLGAHTLVSLDENLEVTAFERSETYWEVHRDLESQGRIGHSLDDCPDRTRPMEIRTWTSSDGWTTQAVALRTSLTTAIGPGSASATPLAK
jgi:hypothetical protein